MMSHKCIQRLYRQMEYGLRCPVCGAPMEAVDAFLMACASKTKNQSPQIDKICGLLVQQQSKVCHKRQAVPLFQKEGDFFTLNPHGKRVMCMSDFEILSLVVMLFGVIVPIILKYIDKKK